MTRLPIPNQDTNQWVALLNDFLRVSHHEDGTLRGAIEVINIRDLGAHGDGVSDDTQFFQAAIAVPPVDSAQLEQTEMAEAACNNRVIFIPAGNYRVSTNTTFPMNTTLSFAPCAVIVPDPSVTVTISGTMITTLQKIFGGLGRIVFGSGLTKKIYPQWWGAFGDGTNAAATTAAIQKAMDAAYTPVLVPQGGEYVGSSQAVEFVAGHYLINDEIRIGAYANIISESKALIEQTCPVKRCFSFIGGYTIHVRGLKFIGGTTQIHIENSNVDTSVFKIEDCEFHLATDFAISTAPTPPANPPFDHLSALLNIDYCKFFLPARVLKNYCDQAEFRYCWITVNNIYSDPDTAIFDNRHGQLRIKAMLGVHGLRVPEEGLTATNRWIDNYGSISLISCRFGGEEAGMPIVYNYAGPQTGYPWVGASIIIQDSAITTGSSGNPESSVINLRTAVPQLIVYENNSGPGDGKLIHNGGNIDLNSYFDPFIPLGGATNFFRIVVDPNVTRVLFIPPELQPFANRVENNRLATSSPTVGTWAAGQQLNVRQPSIFGPAGFLCHASGKPGSWVEYGKTSPFPIGPRPPQRHLGDTPRSQGIGKYSFNIPTTVQCFVCLVTVRGNPNFVADASFQTVASYFVSLTTGQNETNQAVDILSSTLMFQPPTPRVSSPSIVSVHFGTDDSGSATRLTRSGGSFTILWNHVSRINAASISIEVLHLS